MLQSMAHSRPQLVMMMIIWAWSAIVTLIPRHPSLDIVVTVAEPDDLGRVALLMSHRRDT